MQPVLESLLHPCSYRTQVPVNFARRLSQNKTANRLARDGNVFVLAQNVNFGILEHDSCLARVFNSMLGLALVSCQATNATCQMVAAQGLYVLDPGKHMQVSARESLGRFKM